MRELVRQHSRFFLFAILAALALRLFCIFRFPALTTDSFVYGDIAKNWLQHGIYGLSGTDEISATYIRLPGYPAFLVGVFAIFGMEHYRAVLFIQMLFDVGTCFLIADLARRLISPRAAKAAFLLAALCPFLANYVSAALTETLEIFFTALALDFAISGIQSMPARKLRPWLGCGLAVGAAILLRPDGGLLLAAIEFYLAGLLVLTVLGKSPTKAPAPHLLRIVLVLALIALAPLVPWAIRNLKTIGRFEPLAPRYANEVDEFVPMGFNHWVKTWMADYASVEEIYWQVPGAAIEAERLPSRAYDSAEQQEQTEELIDSYNQVLHIPPEMDAAFATLAEERIQHSPLRYYVWLPAVRIADMWLRPRTEELPSDVRWWEFDDDPKWSALAVGVGLINLLYILAAAAGLVRTRTAIGVGLFITFVVLRSAFLGTLENPEPRYTLECYPIVIFLASVLFR